MTFGRHFSLFFLASLTSGVNAQYIIDLSAEKMDLPGCGVTSSVPVRSGGRCAERVAATQPAD
jgi:hypothetical protein